MRKILVLPQFMATAVFLAPFGPVNAAVIFSTDITGVNTTAQDPSYDATGVTWTTNGIATPSSTLAFTGYTVAAATNSFGISGATSNAILPLINIGSGNTWATSVAFSLNPSTTIDLTQFVLNWVPTTSNGGANNNRAAIWTVEVVGSSSGSLGSVNMNSTGNGITNVAFDLLSFADLNAGETYTLNLSVVENNASGFYAQLNDFQLSGNITAVPEPATLLLSSLGLLLMFRRRRCA